MGAGEGNRVVTVSAWPLGVLVEIEDFDWFDVELDRLLQLITTEPHPIRRSDAVFALLQRGQRAPVALGRKDIGLSSLSANSSAGHGWKRDRNLRDAAVILKHVGLADHASRCIEIIENARVRRQAQRRGGAIAHCPRQILRPGPGNVRRDRRAVRPAEPTALAGHRSPLAAADRRLVPPRATRRSWTSAPARPTWPWPTGGRRRAGRRSWAPTSAEPMLAIGREKCRRGGAPTAADHARVEADTLRLPFPDDTFQIVSRGLRAAEPERHRPGLREMARCAGRRTGGRAGVLHAHRLAAGGDLRLVFPPRAASDRPGPGPKHPGGLQLSSRRASADFPRARPWPERMRAAGLGEVWFHRFTFGIATLYVGTEGWWMKLAPQHHASPFIPHPFCAIHETQHRRGHHRRQRRDLLGAAAGSAAGRRVRRPLIISEAAQAVLEAGTRPDRRPGEFQPCHADARQRRDPPRPQAAVAAQHRPASPASRATCWAWAAASRARSTTTTTATSSPRWPAARSRPTAWSSALARAARSARSPTAPAANLIHRAAEVHLKERRKLILVPRETPLSLVQMENMQRAAEAGAVILPAMPGFYHGVKPIRDLVDFVVARICDQLGIANALIRRWGRAAVRMGSGVRDQRQWNVRQVYGLAKRSRRRCVAHPLATRHSPLTLSHASSACWN